MGRSRVAAATTLVSEQALKLLKSVNLVVSIPGISAAADAALSILAITQSVQTNKDDFIGVGEKACLIMVEVIRKVNVAEQPNSSVNKTTLEQESAVLCGTMKDIKKIIKKHVHGRKRCALMQWILFLQADRDVIKECKDRLQSALDVFALQGFIEIRKGIDELKEQLHDLAKDEKHGGNLSTTEGKGNYSRYQVSSRGGKMHRVAVGQNAIVGPHPQTVLQSRLGTTEENRGNRNPEVYEIYSDNGSMADVAVGTGAAVYR